MLDEPSVIGGLCPAGGYCPAGSFEPTNCPSGTYNNYTGATSKDDCADCPPGYYCAGSNNPYPTGKCAAGYYCNSSSTTPYQYEVPPGYFSIEGASQPAPCTPGTYQTYPGEASCLECPAGQYCDAFGATGYTLCPFGSYCIAGTSYPEKCPAGTYGKRKGLNSTLYCTKCESGFYCDDVGATEATQKACAAGFWRAAASSIFASFSSRRVVPGAARARTGSGPSTSTTPRAS